MDKKLNKVATALVVVAALAVLIVKAASLFAGDGVAARPLVRWTQKALGLLPESYMFGDCSIPVPENIFILNAQYEAEGRLWTLGLMPRLRERQSSVGRFHMLSSTMRSPEVVIEWLTDNNKENIEAGRENCLKAGSCIVVPDALGSGKSGLQMGSDRLPVTTVVPELGISVTTYVPTLAWLRCVRP
jgi:hypothetical protein